MPKVAAPTTFPAPGRYQVSIALSLLCDTPGASFFYTTDGSLPTRASQPYDPYRLIMLEATNDARQVSLRVLAVKAGFEDSGPLQFDFTLARRDRDAYLSREIHPGVWMIQDNDDDKMFLVKGARKALMIDTGYGNGSLRAYVEKLAGGLPLELAITHAHPDHVAQVDQFQTDCPVYMHPADLPLVKRFIEQMNFKIDPTRLQPLTEDYVFDLGGTRLRVYEVPGHTAGSIVLLDEQTGILYAGDAVGSNRAANADSLWMQFEGMSPIDEYLSTLIRFRARVGGQLNEIYTGHNETPVGEAYLDNLQKACQNLVDGGLNVLVPSPRPLGVWQSVAGERLTSPDWAAINVSKETCLTAPSDKIASLSSLELTGAGLNEPFSPFRLQYSASVPSPVRQVLISARTTSSRCQRLSIDGREDISGASCPLQLVVGENLVKIEVTSPDGSVHSTYELSIMVS